MIERSSDFQLQNSILVQSCWFFYHSDISTLEDAKEKLGKIMPSAYIKTPRCFIYFDQTSKQFRLIYSLYNGDFYTCDLDPNDTIAKLAIFFKKLNKKIIPVIYCQLAEWQLDEAKQVIEAVNNRQVQIFRWATTGDPEKSLIPLHNLFVPSKDDYSNCFDTIKVNDIIGHSLSGSGVNILLSWNGYEVVNAWPSSAGYGYEFEPLVGNCTFFIGSRTRIINIPYQDYQGLKEYRILRSDSYFCCPVDRGWIIKKIMEGDWLEQANGSKSNNNISDFSQIIENAPGYEADILTDQDAENKLRCYLNELKLLATAVTDKSPSLYILRPFNSTKLNAKIYVVSIMDTEGKVNHFGLRTCGAYSNFVYYLCFDNFYSIIEVQNLSKPLRPALISGINTTSQSDVIENNSRYYPSPLQSVIPPPEKTENKGDNEKIDNKAFTP